VGLAGTDLITALYGGPVSSDARPVHFVVEPGDTAATVADRLEAAGLIRSGLAFRLVVRSEGLGARLFAGDYELRPNMTLDEVIAILTRGQMSGGFLTVPEGWRALQVGDALQRARVTSRDAFVRVVDHRDLADPTLLQQLPPGGTLEGFLFPDSYRFEPNTPARDVARTMVDNFFRHLSPDLRAGFQAEGLSLGQAVTLASIVEREAVVPGERPIIASVYLNRLQRGMRLDADPTVQYALVPDAVVASATPTVYWILGLTSADLSIESPYNTYQVTGLPPGPICSPGLASLEAVAHPASTDYLYFVARPDHSHAFARTLQEQQQNVAKYQP
jgi:UPF0755 protein